MLRQVCYLVAMIKPYFHPDYPKEWLSEEETKERFTGQIMTTNVGRLPEIVRILEVILDGTRPIMVRAERMDGKVSTYALMRLEQVTGERAKAFVAGYVGKQ